MVKIDNMSCKNLSVGHTEHVKKYNRQIDDFSFFLMIKVFISYIKLMGKQTQLSKAMSCLCKHF